MTTQHKNDLIRITDLAARSDIIEDQDFTNCEIVGPAVIAVLDNVSFDHNTFDGDMEAILWEIPDGRTRIIGAVGVRRCTFTDCTFRRIGLAGPKAFTKLFRKNVNITPPSGPSEGRPSR